MSHSDIWEMLDIPKSSLTQLLKNLLARGYVETTPTGRGYRLGDALLSLSESTGQIRKLASHVEAVSIPYFGWENRWIRDCRRQARG